MTAYVFLTSAIALNMTGHLLLKLGATTGGEPLRAYLNPASVLGVAAYGLSTIGYIAALRTMALSVAMPSMVVGYMGTALIAHWLWGEAFGPRQVAAFALIALGVYMLHR